MKLNIGDKVKFLNQSGGGIVTKILSSQMVNVADNDGFEIPTLVNELVKIDPKKSNSKLFHNENDFPEEKTLKTIVESDNETPEFERISLLKRAYNSHSIKEGIYIAFVPHEQRWVLTGNMDIYLLNYTNYELLFSLFLRDIESDNFIGQDFNSVPKYSKILLETIDQTGIPQWSNGILQGLFHIDNDIRILNPISTQFKVNEMRFLKEESYKAIPIIGEKALLVTIEELASINDFAKSKNPLQKDKTEQEQAKKKKSTLFKDDFLPQEIIGKRHAEIDLHIDELSENTSILSPEEMLKIQLLHFEKALNMAIENKLEKITFIHGVGSGKLKIEIIKILKQYEGLHWFDAPMSKYGVGATDILIGQNPQRNL